MNILAPFSSFTRHHKSTPPGKDRFQGYYAPKQLFSNRFRCSWRTPDSPGCLCSPVLLMPGYITLPHLSGLQGFRLPGSTRCLCSLGFLASQELLTPNRPLAPLTPRLLARVFTQPTLFSLVRIPRNRCSLLYAASLLRLHSLS